MECYNRRKRDRESVTDSKKQEHKKTGRRKGERKKGKEKALEIVVRHISTPLTSYLRLQIFFELWTSHFKDSQTDRILVGETLIGWIDNGFQGQFSDISNPAAI